VINQYVGNLPPMPGVFPDYPAPVAPNAGAERELTMMRWGMPPPPRTGGPPVTNIRNTRRRTGRCSRSVASGPNSGATGVTKSKSIPGSSVLAAPGWIGLTHAVV
jgi:hypothetical protein